MPSQRLAFNSDSSPRQAFVAIIDVLGFKNRLREMELSELNAKYRDLLHISNTQTSVNVVTSNGVNSWSVGKAIFSDTIVLCCNDGWDEIQTLISATAYLITDALEQEWPLRGAIAYGSCVFEIESNVIIGQPVVDAHIAEESQEWIGVGLHSTVINHPKLGNKIKVLDDVIRYHVPVKCCSTRLDYAVHWGPYSMSALTKLRAMSSSISSSRARRKYAATIKYLRKTCQNFHALN